MKHPAVGPAPIKWPEKKQRMAVPPPPRRHAIAYWPSREPRESHTSSKWLPSHLSKGSLAPPMNRPAAADWEGPFRPSQIDADKSFSERAKKNCVSCSAALLWESASANDRIWRVAAPSERQLAPFLRAERGPFLAIPSTGPAVQCAARDLKS